MRERHDPIEGLKTRLIEAGIVTAEDLKTMDKEVRGVVNEAARFAQDSPEPDLTELHTDILVDA